MLRRTTDETVVLLTQLKPDMSIEITMTEEDLELTRTEAKATYKQITDYVQNKGKHDELLKQEGIYKNFITGRKQAVSWKLA